MKLINSNNHILVELKTNVSEESLFLIDTGSPKTFSINKNISNVLLNEAERLLSYDPSVNKNDVDKLVGNNVAGFIGMDILKNTGLTIDYLKNEIYFETHCGYKIMSLENLSSFANMFIAKDLIVNDTELNKIIIDTGAYISYVDSSYLNEKDIVDEKYKDWNPSLGEISGNYYWANISDKKKYSHTIKCGTLKNMQGFDAFIGPKDLIINEQELAPKQSISFDFANKTIYIF